MLKFTAKDGSPIYIKKDSINMIGKEDDDDNTTAILINFYEYLVQVQGTVKENYNIYNDDITF